MSEPLDRYRRDGHAYGLNTAEVREAAADARVTLRELADLTRIAEGQVKAGRVVADRIRAERQDVDR